LLEWRVPPPTGRPHSATNLGHSRLGFYVRDLDAVFARAVDAGVITYGQPHATGIEGSDPVRAVVVEDPDGMMVELVQVGTDRVGFVAIAVSDVARSKAFYTDVLGFHPMFDRPPTRQPGDQLGLDGEIELTATYLDDPRGTGAFMVELVQLLDPPPSGAPASAANQLGMYRLALYTDDIDRDHADLVARDVRCLTPPATLEMGPGIPRLRALMFEDPDGTVLELIEPPR
jgi:catechol 2,3-dioxygenase-like lactoylglutathione lyase family enzyme